MPATALAQPVVPLLYHGTVKIGGFDADIGTIISAWIDEEEVATNAPDGTTEVGIYELDVVADEGDTVVLKVEGVVGGEATHPDPMSNFDVVLNLSIGEAPPPSFTADAGGPYYVAVGEEITLSGSASGGTSPYTYAWDLDGDEVYDDSDAQNPSYTWDAVGSYTIGLQVTDSASPAAMDTDTATVTVTEEEAEFDPYTYDTDPKDGEFSYDETLAAVNAFLAGTIGKSDALEVVKLYFLSP